jgi:hypothetical protein
MIYLGISCSNNEWLYRIVLSVPSKVFIISSPESSRTRGSSVKTYYCNLFIENVAQKSVGSIIFTSCDMSSVRLCILDWLSKCRQLLGGARSFIAHVKRKIWNVFHINIHFDPYFPDRQEFFLKLRGRNAAAFGD